MQDNRNNSRTKGTYDAEALEELISALLEASGRGAVIIVEGGGTKSHFALGSTGTGDNGIAKASACPGGGCREGASGDNCAHRLG